MRGPGGTDHMISAGSRSPCRVGARIDDDECTATTRVAPGASADLRRDAREAALHRPCVPMPKAMRCYEASPVPCAYHRCGALRLHVRRRSILARALCPRSFCRGRGRTQPFLQGALSSRSSEQQGNEVFWHRRSLWTSAGAFSEAVWSTMMAIAHCSLDTVGVLRRRHRPFETAHFDPALLHDRVPSPARGLSTLSCRQLGFQTMFPGSWEATGKHQLPKSSAWLRLASTSTGIFGRCFGQLTKYPVRVRLFKIESTKKRSCASGINIKSYQT